MYFQYGSYRHEAGEVRVEKPNPQNTYSSDGILTGVKVQLVLSGRKHGANPSALTAALAAMEAAYAVDGQDAVLYEDDGTPTALRIENASTINGVQVSQPPAYAGDTRGQYATYVDYTIVLGAELSVSSGESSFDYTESVVYSPPPSVTTNKEFVIRKPLDGQVQRQASNVVTFTARQTGSVSSKLFWMQPQSPMYPAHCHGTQSSVQYSVKRDKNTAIYVTSWDYSFESDTPLSGYPALSLY